MNNWFEVEASYIKELEDGTLKKVKEKYIFDAVSVTESEARIVKEVGEAVRGEFRVSSSKEVEIDQVLSDEESEIWWKVVISSIIENPDTGKSKEAQLTWYIEAAGARECLEISEVETKKIFGVSSIKKIERTKVIDIYAFSGENHEK